MIGTTNRKIIVVPCIVKSSLYVCGVSSVLSAWLSCRRIISASVPPRMKKQKVRTRYMIPIFLWSVVVTHDVQPRGSRRASWAVTWGTGETVVGALAGAAMDQGLGFSGFLGAAGGGWGGGL